MDKEKETAYNRQYYQEHREKILGRKKQDYQKHKEVRKAASRQYHQEHKEQRQKQNRYYGARLKREVLVHYSGGTLRCARCAYNSNINGLTIDHIEGGGRAHLRRLGIGGNSFYRWLINNNYPEGFQVLCGACQLIKAIEEDK